MSDPNTNDPDLAVNVNPPETQPSEPNAVVLTLDEAAALRAVLDYVDTHLAADDAGARSPAVMKCRAMFKPIASFWKPARERN